jgi:hypothetical protein
MKHDLLTLVAMRLIWPRGPGRAEFKTELHLNIAIENALHQRLQTENPDTLFCRHCGVVNPTYKDGRCSDCEGPSP